MARCIGPTVILESPTIPTYTEETADTPTATPETTDISINIDPGELCDCQEPEGESGRIFSADLPPREFLADFDTLTDVPSEHASVTDRPDAVSSNYLMAFSIGPINIGDANSGARNRVWRARADNTLHQIFISRSSDGNANWEAETFLFGYVGDAQEIDLAFEQNARPVVVLEISGSIFLYWFDPLLADFTLEDFDTGRNPRLILDNPELTSDSDVLLFYIRDASDKLVYRVQRDRYDTRYDTPITGITNTYLEEVVRTKDWRVACIMVVRNTVTGRYSFNRLETTMYPVPVGPDELDVDFTMLESFNPVVVIENTLFDIAELEAELTMQDSLLVEPVILHTLFDIDELEAAEFTMLASTNVVVVIEHTLFDKDELEAELTMLASTNIAVVIEHTLFDKDELEAEFTMLSGSLVNA